MEDSQNASSTQTGSTDATESRFDNNDGVDQPEDVGLSGGGDGTLTACGDKPISESDANDKHQNNVVNSQTATDKTVELSNNNINENESTTSSITSIGGEDTENDHGLTQSENIDQANVNQDFESSQEYAELNSLDDSLDEDGFIQNGNKQFDKIEEVEEEPDEDRGVDPSKLKDTNGNQLYDPRYSNSSSTSAGETDASFSVPGLPIIPIIRGNNRVRTHEQRKSLNIIPEEGAQSATMNESGDGTWITLKEHSSLLSKESTFGTRLPPLTPGQAHIGRIPTATNPALASPATDKRDRDRTLSQQSTKSRVPPSFQRVATFTNLSRSRMTPRDGPSRYYEEPRRPRKLVSWSEAANARPPLQIDLDGPGPCDYSPRNKPLQETNSPSWSFGQKCAPEKDGGARTSWTKSWFQSPHLWSQKLDFRRDKLWPTPNQYTKGATVGVRHTALHTAPAYSLGARKHKPPPKKEGVAVDKEIASCEYFPESADMTVFRRAASFSHGRRRGGTILWASAELTPGPGSYEILNPSIAVPAFTIRGFRRDKSHQFGPFATL